MAKAFEMLRWNCRTRYLPKNSDTVIVSVTEIKEIPFLHHTGKKFSLSFSGILMDMNGMLFEIVFPLFGIEIHFAM